MSDQYPPVSPPPPGSPVPQLTDGEARQWAGLSHLLGGILGFLAPLIIWAIYKDRSPYVAQESKKALNFQLLALIGYIVSSILMIVLIGFLTYAAIWLLSLYFGFINYQAVNEARETKYPVDVQLIK